jgi:hypothetical protein
MAPNPGQSVATKHVNGRPGLRLIETGMNVGVLTEIPPVWFLAYELNQEEACKNARFQCWRYLDPAARLAANKSDLLRFVIPLQPRSGPAKMIKWLKSFFRRKKRSRTDDGRFPPHIRPPPQPQRPTDPKGP